MRMPPIRDDLPDASYADAVFTVVSLRTAIVTGFVAGAIVLCIPFAILIFAGLFGTFLLNRGTIELTTSYVIAPGSMEAAARVLALFFLSSSILGAVMGAVRRWSVQRGVTWPLLVGFHFSTHPGPQTVLALIVVPSLIAGALHMLSLDVGYLVSIAPVLFFMFPFWTLSGFVYETVWEPLVFLILRMALGEPMMWLRREAALVHLLKDDSELYACRLVSVRIDPDSGVAYVRGDFRTPDHYRRVRDIGQRVIGVREVEAEGLTLLEREHMTSELTPEHSTGASKKALSAPDQQNAAVAAGVAPHRRALRTMRSLWHALAATVPRTSRNGGHDYKEQ
ncbi:MAG: hypothetical protein F4X83_04205 [Chloroflexi bacterium]|nr:hypothetical protein [Chloroflexota bacterium]